MKVIWLESFVRELERRTEWIAAARETGYQVGGSGSLPGEVPVLAQA